MCRRLRQHVEVVEEGGEYLEAELVDVMIRLHTVGVHGVGVALDLFARQVVETSRYDHRGGTGVIYYRNPLMKLHSEDLDHEAAWSDRSRLSIHWRGLMPMLHQGPCLQFHQLEPEEELGASHDAYGGQAREILQREVDLQDGLVMDLW